MALTLRAIIATTAPRRYERCEESWQAVATCYRKDFPENYGKLRPCALFAKQRTATNEAHNNPKGAPPIHATLQANQAP